MEDYQMPGYKKENDVYKRSSDREEDKNKINLIENKL